MIKWQLRVGAGLPRHTPVSFPMMIPFLEAPKHQNSSNKRSYRTPRSPSENHGKIYQSFREDKGDEIIWVPLIKNLSQPKKFCTNIYKPKKISFSTDVERFSDLLGAQVEDKNVHSLQACLHLEEALWEAFLGREASLLGEELGCGSLLFLGLHCPTK